MAGAVCPYPTPRKDIAHILIRLLGIFIIEGAITYVLTPSPQPPHTDFSIIESPSASSAASSSSTSPLKLASSSTQASKPL